MTNLENRVLVLETNIQNINQSLTEIRSDVRDLNRKVDSNLKWLLSVILATWITTIGAVIGSAVAL